MEALKRYLDDCENKRRRMRDRPSNAVLAELRTLLEQHHEEVRSSRRSEEGGEGAHSESV